MPAAIKSEVRLVSLDYLVRLALTGKLRIPPFQRPFRWGRGAVEGLFDSLYLGYPIGSLYAVERPASAAAIQIGPLAIEAPAVPDALWIIDGRQRVTSLVGALALPPDTDDPRFRLFFDVRTHRFVSADRQGPLPETWLPLSIVLNPEKVSRWQRDRPWLSVPELDASDAAANAIRRYEIPMGVIRGDDDRVLVEIFTRLNTSGMALRKDEVVDALSVIESGLEPGGLTALGASVRALGFGEFSGSLLLQSMSVIQGRDVERIDRDSAAFAATGRALVHVVEFLRDNCGIPDQRLVPYSLFIPVLARFAAVFGAPTGRPAELLRRWVWRGSIVGPAPMGNAVALRRYAEDVHDDPAASALRLLGRLKASDVAWWPDLRLTSLSSPQGRLSMLALLALRPRIVVGDDDAALGDLVDIRVLLDSGKSPLVPILAEPRQSFAHCLIHPVRPREVLVAALTSGDLPTAVFRSQCLPDASLDALAAGDVSAFHEFREAFMQEVIHSNVQRYALFGFPDGPDPSSLFEGTGGEPDGT